MPHLEVLMTYTLMVLLAVGVVRGQQLADAPNAGDALFQSGNDSLAAGKHQEAEKTFRKLAELEPSNGRGNKGVVAAYLAQKRYDEAITLLQAESKKYPTHLEYHADIGEVALGSRKYDLAITEFLFVLNRLPRNGKDTGELYYRLGRAYFGQGKMDFALIFLRQALALLPGNAKVSALLAITLDTSGQKEAAVRAYRAALDLDPNSPAVLNNLAFLLCEQGGNLDTALTYAKRARELAPNSDAIADTLGWVSLKKNMTDEAISLFREALQKEPARSTYHYHLAVALEQKGDHAGAMEELQAALKGNPSKDEEAKIKDLMAKIGK
jgi:tetratricopeptide (TPR) repeat protein